MGGGEGERKVGKGIREEKQSPPSANHRSLACIPYQTGAGDRDWNQAEQNAE